MPRIRTIKPEFPQSESMGRVSRDARLCFILLWTIADDFGRLRGNSRMLASLLYPYDDDAPSLINNWLDELVAEKCIVRYAHDGQNYIEICNWLKHQKIDHPSKSKFPAPDESSRILANPREPSRNPRPGPRTKDQGPRIKDQGPAPTVPDADAPVAEATVCVEPAEKPKAAKTKALVPKDSQQGDLYQKILKTFEAVSGQFANYGKEGAAIKRIIKLAGDEPTVGAMLHAFYQLTKGNDRFWSRQPYTPSALLSLWDRVKVEAQHELERHDVSWIDDLEAAYAAG